MLPLERRGHSEGIVVTAGSDLGWLPEVFDLGFCVTFARDVEPDELLVRMGGDPGAAVSLSAAEAETRELEDEDAGPIVRVGSYPGWAFAVEIWGAHGTRDEVVRAVSAKTEAVVLLRNANAVKRFVHAQDGVIVCSFDVDLPHLRTGSDPDRLLPHMERVGLAPEIGPDVDASQAMLSLAVSAFGVGLPRDEVQSGVLPASRVTTAAGE
ncbi:DUF6461 domain-containing protein [Wenjunlia tyrosinilytica]|uniref:DUF6461 domain-containing protein n=1 Tax=Wenjunlia tyrosinilytica TaxID=1544741 RepID=UPI001662B68B|nr:DUF6461 domain-containing protein [Wenjunlia tyrosinilytica]